MAPQRKHGFRASGDDLEVKRAREEKSLAECAQLALDDNPDIAELTEKLRKGLIMEWKEWVYGANSVNRLLTTTVSSYFSLLKDPADPAKTIDLDSV